MIYTGPVLEELTAGHIRVNYRVIPPIALGPGPSFHLIAFFIPVDELQVALRTVSLLKDSS